jgi:hypothetical protein
MRFRLLARRITLAPALVLALALTAAACSSSSSSTPASSPGFFCRPQFRRAEQFEPCRRRRR